MATLKRFGIFRIFGDQFAAEPIRQALAREGITYVQVTTLGSRAVQVWTTLRTLVMSRQVALLDDAAQAAELKRLELVVTSGGSQRVEASEGHDDRAVVLAVCAHHCVSERELVPMIETLRWGADEDERPWHRVQ